MKLLQSLIVLIGATAGLNAVDPSGNREIQKFRIIFKLLYIRKTINKFLCHV